MKKRPMRRSPGLEDEHPDDWSAEERDRRKANRKCEEQLPRMEPHAGRHRETRVRVVDPVQPPEERTTPTTTALMSQRPPFTRQLPRRRACGGRR